MADCATVCVNESPSVSETDVGEAVPVVRLPKPVLGMLLLGGGGLGGGPDPLDRPSLHSGRPQVGGAVGDVAVRRDVLVGVVEGEALAAGRAPRAAPYVI